ncbi:MAG: sulfite exporter TauE/SafE family protein [Rubrobacteraceae bacterium]
MDWIELLLLAVVGIFGGVLSGLVGVGGGIVFVPGLVYVAGWDVRDAVAASLGIIIFSSLSGTVRSVFSKDPVNWRCAGVLSAAGAPAALIGVAINRSVPEEYVQLGFSLLLLVLAYPTARGRKDYGGKRRTLPLAAVIVLAAVSGVLAGMLGVGGGALLVPLMMLGLGLKTKQAVSTSLAVVTVTATVGILGYLYAGFDELSTLPPLIIGSIFGAMLGVRVRDRVPSGAIRVAFAGFMVVVAINGFFEAGII